MPDAVQQKNGTGGGDAQAQGFERVPVIALLVILALVMLKPAAAAAPEELVSFSCALAIKAVFTELEKLSENPVTKEAIGNIDDKNGQFVCISINPKEIQVRLQSTDLTSTDNRLVFVLDAATYVVRKTYFGR